MIKYIEELKQVRAAAIEHFRALRELFRLRRQLSDALLVEGFAQADLARELWVTRQTIQKVVAADQDARRQ